NENEIVKFIQQSADSAVLNRVLGGEVSKILGSLQSNGKVFIVNPAGIVFGKNAAVDVSSLVASTLDITNEDFLNGNYVFNQDKDKAIAQVINQGMIKVGKDGSLSLIGGSVMNTGVLEARDGSIFLLAGQSITIQDLNNPLISYKVTAENKAVNLGQIIGKNVTMVANKVAHGANSDSSFADIMSTYGKDASSATIDASGTVVLYGAGTAKDDTLTSIDLKDADINTNKDSVVVTNAEIRAKDKVQVLGDKVRVGESSSIVANGGKVEIGGDAEGKGNIKLSDVTVIDAGAKVDTSATGDAGDIAVWGNATYVDGQFLAESKSGKGGLVETSGKYIDFGDNFDVSAISDLGIDYYGEWLLDPVTLKIVHGSSTSRPAAIGNWYDGNVVWSNTVTDALINSQLSKTNVTLISSGTIEIKGAVIKGSNGKFLNINSQSEHIVIENSSFDIDSTLTIVGHSFSAKNSTFKASSFVLGSQNDYHNYTGTKWQTVLVNSTLIATGTNTSFLRANSYGGFESTNSTIKVENATLNLKSNSNATFTCTTLAVKALDIVPRASVDSTFTIKDSNFTVSDRTGVVTPKATLIVENSTVDGKGTANINFQVKSVNVKDSKFANTQSTNLSTVNGNLVVDNSTIETKQETALQAVNGDITFNKGVLDVASGNLSINTTGTASLNGNVEIKLNEDASLNLKAGKEANIDAFDVKAKNVTVEGGTVNVRNSKVESSNASFTAVDKLNVQQSTINGSNSVTFKATNSDVTVANNNISTNGTLRVESSKNAEVFGDNANYTLGTDANVVVKAGDTAKVGNFDVEINSVTLEGEKVEATNNKFKLKQGFTVDLNKTLTLDNTTVEVATGEVNVSAKEGVTLKNNSGLTGTNVTVTSANGNVELTNSSLTSTVNHTTVNGSSVILTDATLKGVYTVNLTAHGESGSVTALRTNKSDAANLNIYGDSVSLTDSSFTGNDTGYATIHASDRSNISIVNTVIKRYLGIDKMDPSYEFITGDALFRTEHYLSDDNVEQGNTPYDDLSGEEGTPEGKLGDLDTEKYNDKDTVYYANGEGLYAWNSGAETTNSLVANKDNYATGEPLTRTEHYLSDDNVAKGNTPYDNLTGENPIPEGKLGDLDTDKYNEEGKVYYTNGEGLYAWNSGAETTNPLVANKDNYTTGEPLTRTEHYLSDDNVAKGNTPYDNLTGENPIPEGKLGDLDTDKYNEEGKVYYANGEGLFAWNSGSETTNPLVGNKDNYKNGDSLVQHEFDTGTGVYQHVSGENTENP
ncbi:filamentous hemagglutinin N-terminal domain-containing protein, partial [Psittacicella gerlachiana]